MQIYLHTEAGIQEASRYQTPASFWDNLSRQYLTPRALQEFDRRTGKRLHPLRPEVLCLSLSSPITLKRFAKRGGPDIQDLRGYPESVEIIPSKFSQRASEMASSNATGGKKTSAYDRGFEQHLIDHGIYMNNLNNLRHRPSNWDEITTRLARRRRSLSPTRFPRRIFEDFQALNEEVQSEADVMSRVFPIITGSSRIPSQGNILFGNIAPLTDSNLVQAQPDFYDGSDALEIKPSVCTSLTSSIIPSTNKRCPYLPNFFAEVKGPGGSMVVAKRQACYDGAVGARGMYVMRKHVDANTVLDNNAYTISVTYSGGTAVGQLTFYVTRPLQSSDSSRELDYRMSLLANFDVTTTFEGFLEGAKALRNAREWAQEQRSALIQQANRLV